MNKLLILAVLAGIVAVSQAIKCFSCSSVLNSNCIDKPNKGATIECEACSKTMTELPLKSVTRGCATTLNTNQGCRRDDFLKSTTCICKKNKCNGAGYAKISSLAIIVTLVIPFAFSS